MSKADKTAMIGVVAGLIKDAIDYRDARSNDRIKAIEYFDGKMRDTPSVEGRSRVVSRDVRAAIKKVLPSAMRTILGGEKVVEYRPVSAGDDAMAEQATDYVNLVVLPHSNGYAAIQDAMHDAALLRNGVLRVWFDERKTVKVSRHTGLDDMAFAQLVADDDVTVLEHSQAPAEAGASAPESAAQEAGEGARPPATAGANPGAQGIPSMPSQAMLHDVRIMRRESAGEVRCAAVPLDEWLIHPDAITIDEAVLCGIHRRERRSDLTAMGFDRARVQDAPPAGPLDAEAQTRRDASAFDAARADQDRDLQAVDYYEIYARIDMDGDGVAELRRMVFIGGTQEQYLHDDDYWDEAPFADLACERLPHQWEGKSIADDVMEIQRIKTVLLRQTLDNLYWQNMPQPFVQDGAVLNPDAVLNPEFGKPVRVRQGTDIRAAIQFNQVPFVAKESFSMLDYMDREITDRTGISDASSGMAPDALQNMTAKATALVESAGVAQTELMVRTLAHGLRRFFKILLRFIIQHQDRPRTVRLRDKWVEFDPRSWDADMDATVNVGLGAGTRERDMMMMQMIIGLQEKLLSSLGPNNPFVKPDNLYAAISQMAVSAGTKSPGLYFTKPDPAEIQKMLQAAASRPTPEQQKAQAAIQIEQARAQSAMQLKQFDVQVQRDKEKAQMEADLHVKFAEIDKNTKAEAARAAADAESDERRWAFEREKLAMNREMAREKLAVQVLLAHQKQGIAPARAEFGETAAHEAVEPAGSLPEAIEAIEAIAAHLGGGVAPIHGGPQ